MLSGGNATLYVSDFAASVRFYCNVLGLRLVDQRGTLWGLIDAGNGLSLSLHAATPAAPRPGTSGAITIGFKIEGSLEEEIEALRARGVYFRGGVVENGPLRMAFFGDPDGNDLHLFQLAT